MRLVRGKAECFAHYFLGLGTKAAPKNGDPTAPFFVTSFVLGRFLDFYIALRAAWKNSLKNNVLAHFCLAP